MVEPRAGEVGGGEGRGGSLLAPDQEGAQGRQEAVRQALHRFPTVDGRAVDPAQLQAPLADVADDIQQVSARRAGVVEGPAVPPGGGFTPSDFPRARLDQKQLDTFLAGLGRAAKR